MKNQFVTYEIAKRLKELGFNDFHSFCYYNEIPHSGKWNIDVRIWDGDGDYLNAPLWQQAIDWLRTEHKLHAYIVPYGDCNSWNLSNIGRTDKETNNGRLYPEIRELFKNVKFKSYHEAQEAAILKAIELIA